MAEEDAHRAYDAGLRSAWERDYTAAIAAARAGDATRLVDLLRGQRRLTDTDYQELADYIESLHRRPGRERDATVQDRALQAQAIVDFMCDAMDRQTLPEKVRQRVYHYVCGIDPGKVDHPDKLDDADALDDVAKVAEHIRKGRHRKTVP